MLAPAGRCRRTEDSADPTGDPVTDPVVVLTPSELLHGGCCGLFRTVFNIRHGVAHKYGGERGSVWDTGIVGALGEIAVAKYLGRYWEGMGALGDYAALDVRGVNVRCCALDHGHLLLHPADRNECPFVFVTSPAETPARFTLRGWILGRDGKRDQYWRDPAGGRPAFFVPPTALHPVASLLPWLDAFEDAGSHRVAG